MTTPDENGPNRAGSSGGDGGEASDVEQIEAELEQTRQALGETVGALTAKLDVKTRTRNRIRATGQRVIVGVQAARDRAVGLTSRANAAATDAQDRPKPIAAIAAGVAAAVTAVTLAVLVRRRRR